MGEGVDNGWAFKERRDWLDQFIVFKPANPETATSGFGIPSRGENYKPSGGQR